MLTLLYVFDLTLLFLHRIAYFNQIISVRWKSTVTENDLIEFNFRSGQLKKQFQRASLPGRNSSANELKKKKGSNRERVARLALGIIAVACLKMRLSRLINHRQSRAREWRKDAAISGKWRKLRHRVYPCCVLGKRVIFFSLFSVHFSASPRHSYTFVSCMRRRDTRRAEEWVI